MPALTELKRRFDYDTAAGRLIYKAAPSPNQPHQVGKPAGSKHCEGGWTVSVQGTKYLHCRLVWMWHHGVDPAGLEIDHIDGNRANDRIENLRLATRQQQQWNVGSTARNTSGTKGVSFYRRLKLWRADIMIDGRKKCLGYFKEKQAAAAAYRQAALEIHGQFAKLEG
jgi:hypothetical protein